MKDGRDFILFLAVLSESDELSYSMPTGPARNLVGMLLPDP